MGNGQGALSVQVDRSITSQDVKIMAYDSDANLAPGIEFHGETLDLSRVVDSNSKPVKDYISRFATVEKAMAYATANGQVVLAAARDGTITNQYGEVMVYESEGNFASSPTGSGIVEQVPLPTAPVTVPNSIRLPEIASAAY